MRSKPNQRQRRKQAKANLRLVASHAVRMTGGALDEARQRYPIQIMGAGLSMVQGYNGLPVFFPPEVLEAAVHVFDGVQSGINHPTPEDDARRPEGSVEGIGGVVEGVRYDPSRQALTGVWVGVDPDMLAKVRNAEDAGVLDKVFEFSVNAGMELEPEPREIDGRMVNVASVILPGEIRTTVDAVTKGAAQGKFLPLAASLNQGDSPMNWAEFLKAKPELAALILGAGNFGAAKKVLESLELEGLADSFWDELKTAHTEFHTTEDANAQPAETVAIKPEPTPEPETATDDTATSETPDVAAIVAEQVAAVLKPARIKAKLEPFSESERKFLLPRLQAAKTEADEDTILDEFKQLRASFQPQPDFGGGAVPLRAGAGLEAGSDEWDKYIAGVDGMFEGKPVTLNGQEIPRFRSIRAAIQAHPAHRGRPITVNATTLPGYMAGTYFNGTVDPHQHPETRGGSDHGAFVIRAGKYIPFKASVSTGTFGEIFADRSHKKFQTEYSGAADWESMKAMASLIDMVEDFKTHRYIASGGYTNIPLVAEQGTYTDPQTPGDTEETGSLDKYGRLEDMSLEALTDPDGQKLTMLPRKLGQAMGATIREDIIDTITIDNANMEDGNPLYDAAHNNQNTTALSVSALNDIKVAMRSQTEAGSNRVLGAVNDPMFLLAPPELMGLAERITSPSDHYLASVSDTGTDTTLDAALFKGKLRVVEMTHAANATDYFCIANPSRMPTFVIQLLQGVPQPEFFQQFDETSDSMFNADKSRLKIRFFWEIIPLDWRAFYFQNVA